MDKRPFLFKKFGLFHHNSTMRIGTDAVLLACWTDISDDDDILDIGTGCGIIPLMLAQKRDSRCPGIIDAVEIDEPSSIEANYNFKNSVWDKQLSVYHCDIRNFASAAERKYDLIISNPPFFYGDNIPSNPRKILARHAGSLSYTDLLTVVASLLKRKGRLSVVLPMIESSRFILCASQYGFNLFKMMRIIPVMGKNPNRVNMQFVGYQVEKPDVEDFVIRNEDHSYTESYKLFLKDYYLDPIK